MKVQIVTGRKPVEYYDSVEDVPYEIVGYTEDLSELRAKGRCVHRAELDNQPIFKGLLSSMFDGGMLRYESQEVYDLLSN